MDGAGDSVRTGGTVFKRLQCAVAQPQTNVSYVVCESGAVSDGLGHGWGSWARKFCEFLWGVEVAPLGSAPDHAGRRAAAPSF